MIVLDTSFIVSYFNTRDQNHLKAVKLMKNTQTALSFTDCTTISVMQENDIEKIATFDGDFGKISKITVIEV